MIINKATTETLELVTSSTSGIDYSISYVDLTATTTTISTSEGKITTATTTTVLSAPAASTQRQVKYMSFKNVGVANNTIYVQKNISTTLYVLSSTVTLLPGELLEYANDGRWYYYAANGALKTSTLTAVGNNTEIQYNNNGVLGSSSNFTYDSSVNTVSLLGTDAEIIINASTNFPSAPGAGRNTIYSKTTSNKTDVWVSRTLNAATAIQNALWLPNITMWLPQAAAGLYIGTSGTSSTGAIVLPTTTNNYTSMRKSTFTNVITTANQNLGIATEAQFFRGGSAGQGGFFFMCRFGITTWTANSRLWVGLSNSSTAQVTSNPSALVNMCGFGIDDTDTAITFMHNDGSGTAVKETIAVQPALAANNGYVAYIYCAPNDNTIYYRLDNFNTGAILIDSFINTELPVNTTMMAAAAKMGNAANTASANLTSIGVNRLYVETDM